jgi:hypothetical protein
MRQIDDEPWALRHDDRPLDHVPQLPHVAGPAMALERQQALA